MMTAPESEEEVWQNERRDRHRLGRIAFRMNPSTLDNPTPIAPRALLHLVNGDSTLGSLRQSGVPGDSASFGDVLYEGPAPSGVAREAWRRLRAEYHVAGGGWTLDACLDKTTREESAIDSCRERSEVVIWCEHDLYDQLNLVQLLDELASRDLGSAKLSLVCIDRFPGVVRFVGLGQLTPDQLASLFPGRRPVSAAQLRLASETWRAFTSPNPTGIEAILARDTSALPFLAGALVRYLEQFPSLEDGLSRTERTALECLAAGTLTFRELFPAVADREERPFMGDDTFWRVLRQLAVGRSPLVTIDGEGHAAGVALTEFGRAVLDGRDDAIRRNGIDRWMGGARLLGAESPWRWSRATRRLVQTPRRASPE